MATTTKTTVRERLSAIGAHLNTLRNQAAVIVAAEDPVAAAGKLAKIAGEMSAAQLIESQLSASLSESDVIAERDRLADLAAKAAATRPRETASFLAVVKATLELEGALNDMASVQYELASGGAGSFTTSVSDLVHAISATRVMWSFSNLGRSGLVLRACFRMKSARVLRPRATWSAVTICLRRPRLSSGMPIAARRMTVTSL